jgi:aspartyl-tRNA(Asn)/glutamyl-tRNA(Gln) amidotransferase subunit A
VRDLAAVAHDIADGTLSPVDLLEQTLRTIERLNPTLNAYITVLTSQARAAAREAEREIAGGHYRGPLHGVPVSVKDLYWTRGIRTTAGARVLAEFVPQHDAAVVERLHHAGAIIVAKANMLEFAYAAVHPDFGPTKNPWNLTRTTSGSSGGSAAAVASGMDFGSFGSDTGGSIRIPAAFCGVVGLKPSYGLVSRYGVVPLSWSLDHAGPFARTSRDLALLLQAVAGYDHRDRESTARPVPDELVPRDEGLTGLRVAVLRNFMDPTVNGEVRDAVRLAVNVLADAGATVTELDAPELEGEAIQAVMDLLLPESSYSHRDWFPARSDAYSDTVRERLEAGRNVPAVSWFAARQHQERVRERMAELQADVDLFALPTTPFVAPPLDETTLEVKEGQADLSALIRMTAPFDLTGQPACSVPCGFTAAGLPIGLQLVGRPFEDGRVLQATHAYQSRTDWHLRTPSATASVGGAAER